MSQPNTFNPYGGTIGAEITPGLNAIIAAAPANVDAMVAAAVAFMVANYYPGASNQVTYELKAIAYHVINSYRSNLVLSGKELYNGNQAPFVEMLIGPSTAAMYQPDTLGDRIADIEDNVGTSELTVNDQIPLFLATTCGTNANNYWAAQIALGGASPWVAHFPNNPGQLYLNNMQWALAAMNGALAAYGASYEGLVDPSTNMVSNKMLGALLGALVATAGKVIYNWIPRIVKPLSLDKERIAIMNNGNNNGNNNTNTAITVIDGTIHTMPILTPKCVPQGTVPCGSWTTVFYLCAC